MVAQQPTVEKATEILNWICEGSVVARPSYKIDSCAV